MKSGILHSVASGRHCLQGWETDSEKLTMGFGNYTVQTIQAQQIPQGECRHVTHPPPPSES